MPSRLPSSRVYLLLAALLSTALTGCPVTQPTPVTRFYVLGALAPGTEALPGAKREPRLSVELSALDLPQYLERPQIVTRVDANRLLLSEFDKWGGNLEKDMTRVLAGNLSQLLATPEIHAARRAPTPVDVRLELQVMEFERAPDGRAHLVAQWHLLQGRAKTLLTSRVSKLASAPIPKGSEMEATVAAMSGLLGELSRDIATAIVEKVVR